MKTIEENITPAIFPTDINGVQVNIGDRVRGFGYICFQDGWLIDRTPIVTANIQDGRLMFGNLSCESFDKFEIIGNIHDKAQQKQALIDMMRGDEELGLYDD